MTTRAPAAPEAERALLGSILIDPDQLDAARQVKPADFYLHQNNWVWDAILALDAQGLPIDTTLVAEELETRGTLAEVGGMAYLTELLTAPATSQNADGYAEAVMRASLRRSLIVQAQRLAKDALEGADPATAAGEAARRLDGLSTGADVSPIGTVGQAVSEWYDSISAYIESGKIPGLTTGFGSVDRLTLGMKRRELLILAARPSMGKTSLAATMSVRQARAGLRVAVFTLEVSKSAWIEAAALAELGLDKMRAVAADLERIVAKCSEINLLPIAFYERGYSNMIDIERAARQLARSLGGLDVIWVDHLAYIDHLVGERSTSLPYLIGQTTKRLSRLGQEYNAAIACLCQLSRKSAIDKNEPQLTDLRDSGEIEQDARQVWFIHRPGYYADPEPPENLPQETRLLVRKNHDGKTGLIPLVFVKSFRRFAEVAR